MALFRQKSSSSKSAVEFPSAGNPSSSTAAVPGLSDDQPIISPHRPSSIRERTASFTHRIRTSSTSSLNKLKRSASSASVSPSVTGHADGPPISPSAGSSSSERKSRRISLSKIFSGSSGTGQDADKTKGDPTSQENSSPGSPSGAFKMGLSKSMSFGSLKSKKEAKTLHRSSHLPQKTPRTPRTPEALPPQLSRSVTPPGQSPNPSLPISAHTKIPSPGPRRAVTPVHTLIPGPSSSAASSPSKIPRRIRVSSNPPLPPQVDTTASPVRARASTSHVATPEHQQSQFQSFKANASTGSASSSRSHSRASQAPSFLLEDPFSTPPPPEVVQPSTSSATAVSPSSSPSTAVDLLHMIQRERSNKPGHSASTNGERSGSTLKRSSSQAESILGGVLEREVEGGGKLSRSPSATRRRRLTGDMMRPREVSLSAKAESLNSPDVRSQTGGSSGIDSMVLTPESPRSQHSPVAFGEEFFLERGVQEALGSPLRGSIQTFTLPSSPPSSTTPDKIPIPLTDELMEALKLGRVMTQSSPLSKVESPEKETSAENVESEETEAEKSASRHEPELPISDNISPSNEPADEPSTPSIEARSSETGIFGASTDVHPDEEEDIRDVSLSDLPASDSEAEHVHAAEPATQALEGSGAAVDEDDDHSVTPTTTDRSSVISSPRLSFISEESSNAAAASSTAANVGNNDGDYGNDEDERDIDSDYVREVLRDFSSKHQIPSGASDESLSDKLDQSVGQKDAEIEKNNLLSEAGDKHQGSSTVQDPSTLAPPALASDQITKPTLDEPKPTLISVMGLSKESSSLPNTPHSRGSPAQIDDQVEPTSSTGLAARNTLDDDSSKTSGGQNSLKEKEDMKVVEAEGPTDARMSSDHHADVPSSSAENGAPDSGEDKKDDKPQEPSNEEKEGERTPVGVSAKHSLAEDSLQKQISTNNSRSEDAREIAESDAKPEIVKDDEKVTPNHPTPVVKISPGLTPQSTPKPVQEGIYNLDESSSPSETEGKHEPVSSETGLVESKLKPASSSSSSSSNAIIPSLDLPSVGTGDVSTPVIAEPVLVIPSSVGIGADVSEDASESIAEQTLKQVLDPNRVILEDNTGELALYEAQIASKDEDAIDKNEGDQSSTRARISGDHTKSEEAQDPEPSVKDSPHSPLSPYTDKALQQDELPKSTNDPLENKPSSSLQEERNQNDEETSTNLPLITPPASLDVLFDVDGETVDKKLESASGVSQDKAGPSTSEPSPQTIEKDTAVVSKEPSAPKTTSSLADSSAATKVADKPSNPSRPNLQSRVLTTPSRSSTPQRPQFPRAATTNSINLFNLPNPFASLLNSQRFFVRIPISLLPTRLTSFAQQPFFSIPSFFPGTIDPLEGSRSQSHSPDSVQAISCASHSTTKSKPGSGIGSGTETGKSLLGTAAGIVGTSVKWGFGWPVLVPLRASQYVLSTLNSHVGLKVGAVVEEKQ